MILKVRKSVGLAKERYWQARVSLDRWKNILVGDDPNFRRVVLFDCLRSASSIRPIFGETALRAAAALKWLIQAQDSTPDYGVSYGYFPISSSRGWEVSYPETTGYIMTTLIEYGRRVGWAEPIERSHRMALWEAEVQMPSGAVQGGKLTNKERQTPAAFNTGMVLDGLVTVLEERHDPVIFRAAELAAHFLIGDLNEEGLFATNGNYVRSDVIKVYNVLCAWAIYRFGQLTGSIKYCESAVNAVRAVLRFQKDNGWFAENCLTDSHQPLTHTIGYATQGILEVGIAAEREDFVSASERTWRSVIPNILDNGFLAGRFDALWHPKVSWSCLTGSAQLAVVGYRLCQLRSNSVYGEASDRLVNFLKALQRIETRISGIDGAIAGSFPITGEYMACGYPNWATKYFLDALMAQAQRIDEPLLGGIMS
jgi:hypothetical protein